MASETPAIDAIPEISDTHRVELIQKISSMAPEISSTTWAVLWLSDIEQLEDLSNVKAGLLSATLTGLVVPTRQILLQCKCYTLPSFECIYTNLYQGASRARHVDSDKTSKRKRSDSIKDMVSLYLLPVTVYIIGRLTIVSVSNAMSIVCSQAKKSLLGSPISILIA